MDRVLIIEDDVEICDVLTFYLSQSGQYETTVVHYAEAALPLCRNDAFDIILMDILLPGIDGISFCAQIRKRLYCPIIFMSCLDDDATIVRAMNMGGDDYLVKPFSCAKLLAYVQANLRRVRMAGSSRVLRSGDIVMDTARRSVARADEELDLSPTEYEILRYLMTRQGEFVSFDELYTGVWGTHSAGDLRTLFTHMSNLRRKIGDDPQSPQHIVTRQREGYVFL